MCAGRLELLGWVAYARGLGFTLARHVRLARHPVLTRFTNTNNSMTQPVEEARKASDDQAKQVVPATIPSRGWALVLILASLWIASLQLRRQPAVSELPPDHPVGYSVDINRASEMDLLNLPEVGPSLVQKIVRHRAEHGDFQRPEDLLAVSGVGPQTLKQLAPYLHFPASAPSVANDPVATFQTPGSGSQ